VEPNPEVAGSSKLENENCFEIELTESGRILWAKVFQNNPVGTTILGSLSDAQEFIRRVNELPEVNTDRDQYRIFNTTKPYDPSFSFNALKLGPGGLKDVLLRARPLLSTSRLAAENDDIGNSTETARSNNSRGQGRGPVASIETEANDSRAEAARRKVNENYEAAKNSLEPRAEAARKKVNENYEAAKNSLEPRAEAARRKVDERYKAALKKL
jgi:hypothetical protein